jgi:hypothetical protein
MKEIISREEHCWNAMRYRIDMTRRVLLECYKEGAFRRLETGSDREREALRHILYICEESEKVLDMLTIDWER